MVVNWAILTLRAFGASWPGLASFVVFVALRAPSSHPSFSSTLAAASTPAVADAVAGSTSPVHSSSADP